LGEHINQGYLTFIETLKTNKTLFIGPLSGNYTGQRISFDVVSRGNFRIDLIKKINILKVTFIFFIFNQVYYTGSRSQLGFIRDLLFIYPFLLTKRRVVNHIHGDDFEKLIFNRAIVSNIALSVCKQMDAIVASSDQAKRLKSYFREVHVVNNFSRFQPEKSCLSYDNRVFLYISTISVDKGIFDWLEISYNLFKFNSKYNFYIIGENILESEDLEMFNERIKCFTEKGMKIYLVGKLDFAMLRHHLSIGTDLIFTSKHLTENRPLVLLEAASMGLTIHCTKHRDLDKIYGLQLNSFKADDNYCDIAYSINNYVQSLNEIEFNKNLIIESYSKQAHRNSVREILFKN
jgi:glycosyltransferase involved in cell wall biosynthesis